MKIAILTEYYPDPENPASGVYVHIRAAAYRRAGHDARVFRVDVTVPGTHDWERVPVDAGRPQAVREAIEAFRPDVIALHTPHPSAPHTRLALSLPTPRVLWIHGYEAMITARHGYHTGLDRLLSLFHDARKLWRLRRALKDAAAVVHVSDWMRRTTETTLRFAHPRTHVIPNPVDTDRFRPPEGRDPAEVPLSGVALRALKAHHGLDVAVEAWAALTGTTLAIVGTGPAAVALRRRIEALGAAVELIERVVPHDEVPELFRRFDFYVAPGRTETQGLAMCEAMACGLPVVGSRVGGIPEFVRDRIDGILVEPDSVESLRRGVRQLVADPERVRPMGRDARAHMVEKCGLGDIVERELEVLRQAAAWEA